MASLERFVPIAFTDEPGSCSLANAFAAVGNALSRLVGSRHRLEVRRIDPLAANRVDAAVARPLQDGWVDAEILEIGRVIGTAEPMLGMAVRKSGRTTGLTRGEIQVLDTTVTIGYGDRQARFDGQIVTSAMSSPGDFGLAARRRRPAGGGGSALRRLGASDDPQPHRRGAGGAGGDPVTAELEPNWVDTYRKAQHVRERRWTA